MGAACYASRIVQEDEKGGSERGAGMRWAGKQQEQGQNVSEHDGLEGLDILLATPSKPSFGDIETSELRGPATIPGTS